MIVFSLFLLVLMLMIGGMAVDLMRYEYARSGTQQTADRAALAAASLKQLSDPDVVAQDYFAKAGLTANYVATRWARPTLNAKQVWVDAEVNVPTFFMHMMDIQTLQGPTNSGAEEAVSNIEISLVLDISGSMRWNAASKDTTVENRRITKLRAAAKQFFATVLSGDAKDFTSINIVPYAGQVNVGPLLFERLGGRLPKHDKSSCLELAAADYTTVGTPAVPADGISQVPHFMNWVIDKPTMEWGWCPSDKTALQVAQNDLTKLNTFIDNMTLHDGTGTQTGLKYGLMLLNPALRDTYTWLIGQGRAEGTFSGRPMKWPNEVDAEVQKYLIVMTDGAITEQVRPKYTAWWDPDPMENTDNETVNGTKDPDLVDGTDHVLWNATVELQSQPKDNRAANITEAAANATTFKNECDLARAKGVIVYTIAFNAGSTAADQMLACATKPSYFFEVGDRDIAAAFAVIARNIRQLRLTQ